MLLVGVQRAQAQQSQSERTDKELRALRGEITQLKAEIHSLEERGRSDIPPAVKGVNAENLLRRRKRLDVMLQQERILVDIAGLQKYAKEVDFLEEAEQKRVVEKIEELRKQKAALDVADQPATEAPASAGRAVSPAAPEAATSPPAAPPSAAGTPAKESTLPQPAAQRAVTGRILNQALSQPLENVVVRLKDANGADVGSAVTNREGEFDLKVLDPGIYDLSIRCDCDVFEDFTKKRLDLRENRTILLPDVFLEDVDKKPHLTFRFWQRSERRPPGGELVRVVGGFEQSGASASKSKQNFFYDMFITVPFPFRQAVDRDFGPRFRLWGDIRIASAPRDFSLPVREFVANPAQELGATKVSEVAQSADYLIGFEFNLGGLVKLLPSFDRKTKQKFSIGLIAAVGGITPLNPRDTLQVFKVSPEAVNRFPQATGKDFIAFVSPDRDRFFRQYFVGFRLKTYYFSLVDRPLYRFPAVLDVAWGINESVTGGRVHGGVFRLDAFYPLPWESSRFVFLFGTALLKPARARITDPLILEAAPNTVTVPAPNVAIVTLPQINRDYYRFGVGVDAISLFKKLVDDHNAKKMAEREKEKNTPQLPPATTKAPTT